MRFFGRSTRAHSRRDERRPAARHRILKRTVGLGAGVALLIASTAIGSSPAFADSVVHGCTVVSNPTATHFTSCPGANLAGANLSALNLSYADLTRTNLDRANLSNTILGRAALTGATLRHADLAGATLAACSFQLQSGQVSCGGADLSGAQLAGANLKGAVTSTCVSIDFGDEIGVVPFCGGALMSSSNLHGADLTGDDLSFALLSAANLTDAKLGGTLFGECAPASKPELL